jgi:hypothetical protein
MSLAEFFASSSLSGPANSLRIMNLFEKITKIEQRGGEEEKYLNILL